MKKPETEYKAIIEAFEILKGDRSIKEIESYIRSLYGNSWKSIGATMADMVPREQGGNISSTKYKLYCSS